MLFNALKEQVVVLGWDFYLPVLIFVVLCGLAVPIWASIGAAAIAMLLSLLCTTSLFAKGGMLAFGNRTLGM